MKRLICVILAGILMIFCASCGSDSKKTESGATEDEANYPKPATDNILEGKTETGLVYNMNLDKFTTEFNSMYLRLGGKEGEFSYKKWKLVRKEKQTNGLNYRYYSLDSGQMVLTATVDDESLRIVNLGCGITAKFFNSAENLRQKVMTVCGTIAAVAGGYGEDDVVFFGNLFVDTIEEEEHCFWYNNSIYLYSGENDSSGETTMLFRTIPAKKSIEAEWNLKDYKEYWLGNKK